MQGAVLYVETGIPGAEFDTAADFAWAVADGNGRAPPDGTPPVTISVPAGILWRPQATITALAPGYEPFVLQWRTKVGDPIGLKEIRLSPRSALGPRSAPDGVSWPNFSEAALRARAKEPAQAPLRAAFREAWEAVATGPLSSSAKAKLAAQRALDEEVGDGVGR